jgi:hypothetical protein
MKRILSLIAALALGAGACQKQPTEAERKAEIERQVQQRLDAERQADDRQKMAQRQAALEAQVEALAAKQNRPVATATPVVTESFSTAATASVPETGDGSYSTFYRKLDPYGDWMETGDYGYVFQPRQAAQSRDWRPYTNGHWVYTDAGWTWISDEKFGWATYHYGRWMRLRNVGWVWVPGEEWAPAWVSWRKGDDYVGWAPLPPEAQFDRQTGIHNWADNYYDIGPEQYAFVPANEFGRKLSPHEIVPAERNVTIINQTTNVTNIVYNNSVIVDREPSYDDLRSRSRQPIARYRLERTNDLNNDVPVFRGEVVALPTADFRPAERAMRPPRVVRTIAQPIVERGWAGIQNAPEAEKARAKMQAEATPANLPPKRFVRPEQRTALSPRPTPVKVSQAASPTVSSTTAIPVGTPAPLPSNPPPAPPTATAHAATARPNTTPALSPRPRSPGGRPQPSATSAEPAQPSPADNIFSPKEADRNQRNKARAAQEEKRKQRQQEQTQRQVERQQKTEERRGQKPGRPEASPSATSEKPTPIASPAASEAATTAPAPSPTPAVSDKKNAAAQRRIRRAEKRAKRGQTNLEASPEPEASAQPSAHQP